MPTCEKSIVIIPARLNSRRFPNKAIYPIEGEPMLAHTYRQAMKAKHMGKSRIEHVCVASADDEICSICYGLKINYVKMDEAKCGSHMSVNAATNIIRKHKENMNVISLQCEYPFIDPEILYNTANDLTAYPNRISTPAYICDDPKKAKDPNEIKMVHNISRDVLYCSRAPIPYNSEEYKLHVGLYGFPYDVAMKLKHIYNDDADAYMYSSEDLEQLMWLERGFPMHLSIVEKTIGIDLPDDLKQL